MDIQGSTALVTGTSRGLGQHFVRQLLERGATKVYATARDPRQIDLPGAVPLALDVSDPASVAAAAAIATDVDLLVNNAGVSTSTGLLTGDLDLLHREFDVNFWGTLATIRAFAPILAANGGGAVLNVLSRMSWHTIGGLSGYAAAKAAAWSLTNGVRLELAEQGTQVTGLYLSATDTDMMAGWDIPKNDPAVVIADALDGLAAGRHEVLADEDTRVSKAALSADPAEVYPELSAT